MGNFVVLLILATAAFRVNATAKQVIIPSCDLGENITSICDEAIVLNEPGFIMSPGFPIIYPENLYCTWLIVAPEGQVIDIKFGAMDIEYEESCIYDSLVIQGQKYCGRTEPEDFITEKEALEITFLSDERVPSSGFILYYEFKTVTEKECSYGYDYHDDLNMCYRVVTDADKTWDEARADCQTVPGGDLIQVINKDVQDFVSSSSANDLSTWLGGTYHSDAKDFVWVKTNTPVSDYDTFWEEGEPNYIYSGSCMFSHVDTKEWRDASCTAGAYYICEHPL